MEADDTLDPGQGVFRIHSGRISLLCANQQGGIGILKQIGLLPNVGVQQGCDHERDHPQRNQAGTEWFAPGPAGCRDPKRNAAGGNRAVFKE